MTFPQRSAVRPHVTIPGGTGTLLLEDEVLARLEKNHFGFVVLSGESGSGRSTALAHLAAVFENDPRLRLVDDPDQAETQGLAQLADQKLVVGAWRNAELPVQHVETWRLASWSQDDWIEYLLSVHHDRCASVMSRVLDDAERHSLGGSPELWTCVLDRFAHDDSLGDVKSALRCELEAKLASSASQSEVCEYCFDALLRSLPPSEKADRLWDLYEIAPEAFPLLRHEVVRSLLAGKYLAEQLRLARKSSLEQPLPLPLIREAARLICEDPQVLESLRLLLDSREWQTHAMAASLLHAAHVRWRPLPSRTPLLVGACLPGVQWQGLQIRLLDVAKSDFTDSDMSESQIDRLHATGARFSRANFHGVRVKHFSATHALFDGADLSFLRAIAAQLGGANMENANLEGALLSSACLEGTNLTCARLCRADLSSAALKNALIEGADFTGANLANAKLVGLSLSRATFIGAQFPLARLQDCDLEYMRLPGSNFEDANLRGAHLTGSQMPQANFYRADLRHTGLAEIEWEGADLRYADLRGSTFHLGSSRSGLVGSPLASEGSRTGFYTDELNEQDFKAPEEIRKANLCGADLRGAKLGTVDFYLVDLRGAHYTAEQGDHFRRCGAILETRV